tara:strand:+ start:441 stop:1334 length:894 start_codon:yes stop_codon:yes gene_type:complete
MKLRELFKENISDKDIQRLKQDAAQIKAMKDSGNADLNKLMPMMKNMAYTAARADMGSKLLEFMQKMAGAIKKGIDTNQYSPNDLPTMQKAYDSIMSQMPELQKMAADSKALALQYGRTDREKASLDDKGNYKGTNIKPTAQQAQQLARNEGSPVDDVKVGLPADSYKVQKGDNIARIYKKFKDTNFNGYSMRDAASLLMDINPEIKDPNMIYPGMVIKMPFQYMDPRTKSRMDRGADYGENSIPENTNASSIATVSGNVGPMQSRNMYNADGTMKNGADFGNLLGGKKKSKKTKKA